MKVTLGEKARGPSDSSSVSAERPGLSRFPRSTLVVILILCAILPYLNTLLNGFVHDDNRQVLLNPYIRSLAHLREIFTTNVWSYMGAQGLTNYYRPLMTTGYLICYQIFGPLAYGYHFINLLLNAGVVLLLFIVTEEMFRDRTLAFMVAALFALHPIHSEAVAWIAAVTDLQLAFFFLLTFWFYLRVAAPGGQRSDLAQFGMAGSFVLAALAKEPALSLPLLATLYEHFYREDSAGTTRAQKLARYGILWLLTIAYLLYRVRILGGLAPVLQMPQVSWKEAFLSAFALIAQYIWKLFWPAHLCAFYVFRKSVSPVDLRVLAGAAVLAGCAVLFVFLWKRARLFSFGVIWFFVTLAPVLNARWLGANVFTERYLYLPSVGFCWIAGWAGIKLWNSAAHQSSVASKAVLAGAGVAAVLSGIRIVVRNPDWRNDVTFYQRTLAAEPGAVGLRINLGAFYWNTGSRGDAEREWRAALKLSPNNFLILNNLGLACMAQKQYEEAVNYFQRSMHARPNYPDAHLNLGRTYVEMGMNSPAELQLRAAVALAPLHFEARNRLGQLYFDDGRLAEAEEQFRHSVESSPNLQALDYLGDIYARTGRHSQAERAFKRALTLDEFDSHAHFALGALYLNAGRKQEALREYQAGLRTDPANPKALAALQKLQSYEPKVGP
jgi:tetratricopeptide (TPR) repeat protein